MRARITSLTGGNERKELFHDELGKLAGGLDYSLVSKAIPHFGRRLQTDIGLPRDAAAIQDQLSK